MWLIGNSVSVDLFLLPIHSFLLFCILRKTNLKSSILVWQDRRQVKWPKSYTNSSVRNNHNCKSSIWYSQNLIRHVGKRYFLNSAEQWCDRFLFHICRSLFSTLNQNWVKSRTCDNTFCIPATLSSNVMLVTPPVLS